LITSFRSLAYGVILWVATCHPSLRAFAGPHSQEQSQPASTSLTPSSSVRSIILPHFEPQLPVAPGRDEFLAVCVSCHSPRYVTMQPLFPQRQWEATVDKMAQTYGAQMDQEQRQSIVSYLVAIHGPSMKSEPVAPADDDFAASASPSMPPETAPGLELARDVVGRSKQVERGLELFQKDCAACHGAKGRGDGFVSQVLLRKPKDLATTRYSLEALALVLWNGKRGTSMPSWRSLPPGDLAALAAYVQTIHPSTTPTSISSGPQPAGSKLFAQNCAPCHGPMGDGKGPVASTLLPKPANFRLKQPDPDYILQVLRDGISGTAMPAWQNQIAESDRQALAGYVRAIFDAANPSGR